MRKWIAGCAVTVVALATSAGAWADPREGDGLRIALDRAGAAAAGIQARHELGNNRVSAHATTGQLAALNRLGVSYEQVPERYIDAPKPNPGRGKTSSRSVPTAQVPYGIKMMYGNPNLAPASIGGGAGVKVAILDTGSVAHPDFIRADGSPVIVECTDFSRRRADLVEGVCTDGHGHGTHVTGTLAAAGGADGQGIFGVAPGAAVMSYKVVADSGRAYADDISRAIRRAADQGAQVISLSLGSSSPWDDELAAINYAVGKGVLVIAAAGNSGPDANTIGYPAAYAQVVAVVALNPDEVVAYFSSRGTTDGNDSSIGAREVEVAAPGRLTLSTYRDDSYYTMSGTSMATPHIAGLAAKMWQGSAGATRTWLRNAAQVHDISRAEQISNAGSGYDIASGYGLPQVRVETQPLWSD